MAETETETRSFVCENCQRTFQTEATDEEATAEAEGVFGLIVRQAEMSVLCDDCYQAFMVWWHRLHRPPPDIAIED